MPAVKLTVNGKPVTADVDPRTLLVQFLRENLRLTGTHVGCDTSQCGACVVHVNGKAVKSCTLLVLTADGADVRTIESLANGDTLHPMQEAFREITTSSRRSRPAPGPWARGRSRRPPSKSGRSATREFRPGRPP